MTSKKSQSKSFQSLDTKKAAQNVQFFAKYTCDDISDSIRFSKFFNEMKQADIVHAHKKSQSFLRKIKDLLVFP